MRDDDHQEPDRTTTAEESATSGAGSEHQDSTPESPGPARQQAGATALLFQAPDPGDSPPPPARPEAAEDDSAEEDDGAEEEGTEDDGAEEEGTEDDGAGQETAPDDQGEDDRDRAAGAEPEAAAEGDAGGEGGAAAGNARRRRRRGGRRRRKSGGGGAEGAQSAAPDAATSGTGSDDGGNDSDDDGEDEDTGTGTSGTEGGGSRRRRRRRRGGDGGSGQSDDAGTSGTAREGRTAEEQVSSVSGSTRLEAKKQRRKEGRDAGRRRAPIVSEAEFLARREAVDRVMAIRQRDDVTQIAVLEDDVLVEHYVARESQTSLIGNIYLGRVQNVLPSMEAAFIDIGQNRNGVIYAGEVNWAALGHTEGEPRKIESVLSSGQQVLVQVTKDPVGHKGARLTGQISLAGRFLVYVPDGTNSGISRKLPDTERKRLKSVLKEIVPEGAGVIVRTAAEGAAEEELTRDVERLTARWQEIDKGAKKAGSAPRLLYGEPDLTVKVVRDLFTEDFSRLVVEGDDAWETVQGYVSHVAPDLEERLVGHDAASADGKDVFRAYRIDEQIAKGLERKVWLPSGGSLIFDRTEAMTVVDVNTGKFTGSGGNLEETVTKNNLEAAEEIVRQLRLRDIGGIIVIDFIDMVLESNRDLVLRRLVECLGRDRTRHQVAEVTSLGLVQMTRKRVGTGLLEAFSESCSHCGGRGVHVHDAPVEPQEEDDRRGRRGRGRGGGGGKQQGGAAKKQGAGAKNQGKQGVPSPADVAAMSRPENTAGAPEQETAPEEPTPEQPAAAATPAATPPEPAEAAGSGAAQDSSGAAQDTGKQTGRSSRSAARTQRAPAPAAVEPVAEKPTTEEPAAAEPATEEPATEESAPTQPPAASGEPSSERAGAGQAGGSSSAAATTRTRRRTASRRTGVSTEAASITVTPDSAPAESTEPAQKPTVTTRTRRRGTGSSSG